MMQAGHRAAERPAGPRLRADLAARPVTGEGGGHVELCSAGGLERLRCSALEYALLRYIDGTRDAAAVAAQGGRDLGVAIHPEWVSALFSRLAAARMLEAAPRVLVRGEGTWHRVGEATATEVVPEEPSRSFQRTESRLGAERGRGPLLWCALALSVIGLWTAWGLTARVAVRETSQAARVQALGDLYRIDAPMAGQISRVHVALGQPVAAGDPLLEIDAARERLALSEAEARLAAAEAQRGELAAEIEATRRAGREAVARAEAALGGARGELDMLERAHRRGSVSRLELVRARAAARKLEASAAEAREEERALALALERQLAALDGAVEAERRAIDQIRHEIDRRTVRAPAAGVIGEIAELRAGQVVSAGQELATVIPEVQELGVVALFPPDALGRIRPGQPARLRLAGYAWTEFGSLAARVERVAGEIRDGGLRVELSLTGAAASSIPLQHGMPGELTVEVDSVRPLQLLLRALGATGS